MVQSPPTGSLPVTVMLAEDCELVANGVAAMLAPYDDLRFVPGCVRSVPVPPDVVLYDPPDLPWSAITRIPEISPLSRLVVYTWTPSAGLIQAAVERGARGCLAKTLPTVDLVAALRRIHQGHLVVDDGDRGGSRWRPLGEVATALTSREREVIELVTSGLSNREIAELMTLSINSIKSYIRSAYRKIGVASRSQAVLWGVRNGYLAPVGPAAWTTPLATDPRAPLVTTG